VKLIANNGPVQVEAQNDRMTLLARKSLSIVSTEDEIRLSAKKITLNGGGSYITLDANAIESGTLGEYRTKANHYSRKGKKRETGEHNTRPPLEENASVQGKGNLPSD
jgi:type VI secretion system secreted protein VgrG